MTPDDCDSGTISLIIRQPKKDRLKWYMGAHDLTLCLRPILMSPIGVFGGTGELYLLLDRCVG